MTTYQRSTVYTSDDIRAIADHAGSHFFDAATMRFFCSRVLEGVHASSLNKGDKWASNTGNAFYFITSERYDEDPRFYQVRKMTLTSVRDDRPAVDIESVGDHYSSANAARNAAKAFSQS